MTPLRPTGLFAIALLTGALSCQRAPYRYQPLPAATAGPTADAAPQLLFLSFRMTTDAAGVHQVAPLLVQAVPGQANPVSDDDEDATSSSYLLISQLDAADQPCGSARRLPHPLVQNVEAPAASAGALQRQTVTLAQAEFFVRLARQPRAQKIRLVEVSPGTTTPLSATFPLPK